MRDADSGTKSIGPTAVTAAAPLSRSAAGKEIPMNLRAPSLVVGIALAIAIIPIRNSLVNLLDSRFRRYIRQPLAIRRKGRFIRIKLLLTDTSEKYGSPPL